MTNLRALIGIAVVLIATPAAARQASPNEPAEAIRTLTGIPLDAQWKRTIYSFAREKLLHPAWGWTHSERDYQLASEVARKERLQVDTDILFAAAFTHDIGAIGDFQKEGVDHAIRSAELAEYLLRDAGFPVAKWPAVREAILGHMFDKVAGSRAESIVLHDADALDFLGTVGVARRLSVTGTAHSYSGGVAKIGEFADRLPGRLVTGTAQRMSKIRVTEMRRFLQQLQNETADGRLP